MKIDKQKDLLYFNFAYVQKEIEHNVKESRYGYQIELDFLNVPNFNWAVMERRTKKGYHSRAVMYNSDIDSIYIQEPIDNEDIDDCLEHAEFVFFGKRGKSSGTKKSKKPREKPQEKDKQEPEKEKQEPEKEKQEPEKEKQEPEKEKQNDNPSIKDIIELWIKAGVPGLLYGPTGSGKTTTAMLALESLGIDYFTQSISEETRVSNILGYPMPAGYVASPFRKAIDAKKAIILDEIDTNPTILLLFNDFITSNKMVFPDKTVDCADNFLIATANTNGTGASSGYVRSMLDLSSRKRFPMLHVPYDRQLEKALCPEHCQILWKIRENCESQGLRNNIVTTRDFVYIQQLTSAGMPLKMAIIQCIVQSDDSAILDKIFYGTSL